MVSPRAAEPDARAAVLRAATRLFAAHGFDGTTLQDVAYAVGVSKPAILHHFPSKEHIREAVLDAILQHWQATLPRLLLAATASEERFEAVFGELFRFFAADGDRARVILREALDRPAEARRLLAGPVRPWIDAIAGYIRAGQASHRHHAEVGPGGVRRPHAPARPRRHGVGAGDHRAARPERGRRARGRYDRELARMARASLFTAGPGREPRAPAPPDAKTQQRAPSPRRKRAR